MYSLSCFLDDHHNTPAMEIDIRSLMPLGPDDHNGEYNECLALAFRPLRIISSLDLNHIIFTNLDNLDQPAVTRIHELWNSPAWVRLDNTPLQVWTNAMKRSEAADALAKQLHDLEATSTTFLPATEMLDEKIAAIARMNPRFWEAPVDPRERFITPENEWDVLEPFRKLDVAVDELDLDEIRNVLIEQVADRARRDLEAMESTIRRIG